MNSTYCSTDQIRIDDEPGEVDAPWFDPEWVSRQRNFPLAPSARLDMFGGDA